MNQSNILAALPGEYVAAAMKELPDPATAVADEIERTFEIAGHGAVAFVFRRVTHRHGKHSTTFWTATRATTCPQKE